MIKVPCNNKGVQEFISKGIGHNITTLIMEAYDNSNKASCKFFKYYKYNNNHVFFDNGLGIVDIEKSITICDTGNNNIDNKSISTFGCGLNAILLKLMNKTGWAFILTKYLLDDEYYQKITYFTIINDELWYNKLEIPSNKTFNIFEENTGTFIYTSEDNIDDGKINIKLIESKIKETMNNTYLDEIIDIDISKLINNKINFIYNNKLIKNENYMLETDELMFNCDIFINSIGNIIYVKDTYIIYKITPARINKEHKDLCDDEYINKNKLINICNVKYYYAKKANTDDNYKILYEIPNIRKLGFSRFSPAHEMRQTTTGYLKAICTFIDVKYLKDKNFFNARKTDTKPLDMTLDSEWDILNKIITKIITNEDILKSNGWQYGKNGNSDKKHQHLSITEEKKEIEVGVESGVEAESEAEEESEADEEESEAEESESEAEESESEAEESESEAEEGLLNDNKSLAPLITATKHKKQKKRGGSLSPGGSLYLITIPSWVPKDEGMHVYKFGKAEDINERIKKHQQNHPIDKIEIIGKWRIIYSLDNKETEILKIFQDFDMQYDAIGTTTSEFIISNDKKKILDIIDNCLPPKSRIKM